MQKKILQTFLLGVLLLLGSYLMAQSKQKTRCAAQEKHFQRINSDPVYARKWAVFEKKRMEWMRQASLRTDGSNCTDGTVTIPVVVHYEYAATTEQQQCLKNLAQSQIDALNQAYSGASCSDGSATQSSSGGCVVFALATSNHPAGSGLSEGEPAVLFGSDPCPNDNNVLNEGTNASEDYNSCANGAWAGYLNIAVKFPIENGTIGIAPFPPEAEISLTSGGKNTVIISSCAFGVGASNCAPYFVGSTECAGSLVNNGGATSVHEIGHFFGLPHTFCYDASGSPSNTAADGSVDDITEIAGCQEPSVCSSGCTTSGCDCDGFTDTPAQSHAQYGCPGGNATGTAANPSTGASYSYNNFMDYVDDACMQCFSTQQANQILQRSREAANNPNMGALPVELVQFTARPAKATILLQWTTASETENDGFELQRSSNPQAGFEKISWIEGHGSTLEVKNYSFEDKAVLPGQTYYYRLRQIDFDGTADYSYVVSAQIEGNKWDVNIYPNPAWDRLEIQFTAFNEKKAFMELYNMNGQLVLEEEINIASGSKSINLNTLPSGIYLVKIIADRDSIVKKLVKQE